MKLYRFSPIDNQAQLIEAVEYIAQDVAKLYFKSTGEMFNDLIESLTVFSHYPEEYDNLKDIVKRLGEPYNENNGPRIKLHQPIVVKLGKVEENSKYENYTTNVKYIRIRKPDPYRMQVGCADIKDDFDSQDFESAVAWPDEDKSPRLIKRREYNMLEFFDPDVDVLGYIVSE
jgi:hypothetical protein